MDLNIITHHHSNPVLVSLGSRLPPHLPILAFVSVQKDVSSRGRMVEWKRQSELALFVSMS